MDNSYIKDELSNPTVSFKDRPTSMGTPVAKEYGTTTIAVASSGNAGMSVAAYTTKAGMCCLVCMPQKTSPGKVGQLMAHSAIATFAPGGYGDCLGIVWEAYKRHGYANLTSTYTDPYVVEGDKIAAYELFEQMRGGVPDWITAPVGTDPLLFGIYWGHRELMAMGLVSRLPHMLDAQAEICSPIMKGFEKENGRVETCADMGDTVTGGIADQLVGYEGDGEHTIRLVRESGGRMTPLTEEGAREAWSELSRTKGAFTEPTGAIVAGGVKKMPEQGVMKPTNAMVALVMGHGLKTVHYYMPGAGEGDSSSGNAEVRLIWMITRPGELV